MINEELLNFIRTEDAKGVSRIDTGTKLGVQGWTPDDIAEAYHGVDSPGLQNHEALQKIEKVTQPVHHGIVASLFRTKNTAFGVFLLFLIIWWYLLRSSIIQSIAVILFGPLVVFLATIFILKSAKYTNEADNAVKAVGMIFLTIVILLVIGFGVCLFLFSR